MIRKVAQSVCQADNSWDFKPLPGALPKSKPELANLGPWDYFLDVMGTPEYNICLGIGMRGGWITAVQYSGNWV